MITDTFRILVVALVWTAPLVIAGSSLLWWQRRMSLLVSLVVMALIPLVATFVGVFATSGLMVTGDLRRTATVLAAVAVVTVPAVLLLGRLQARRTVWERQMREQERAADQSRRDLIAWISHDLRTPITDIKILAESLTDGVVTGADDTVAFATQIGRDVDRLSAMVDDLFEMSTINADALQLDMEEIDLREVIDEVVGSVRSVAERGQITLDVLAPDDAVGVTGSAPAMSRVVTNLVTNALAHTPPGGCIRIATGVAAADAPDGQAQHAVGWCRVDDSGSGIDEDDLPRIFEMAYRGGSAARSPGHSATVPTGSGMGLAIARGLVDAQNGSITASNTASGARFEVRIPLAVASDDG
ncbi:HAMP domain-containing sensor histidine kinase [Gordonia sp. VNQ95]|uniref:sensor histidine kinase n=1 Tax=Gordonia TaxID=2053 RepID=UPI0032B5E492